MSDLVTKLREQIQKARLKKAVQLFAESLPADADPAIRDELTTLQGDLSQLDADRRRSIIEARDYSRQQNRLADQLLKLAQSVEDDSVEDDLAMDDEAAATRPPSAPRIFLSYNHQDQAQALAIKQALEQAGLSVHIDIEQMRAGQDIRQFIRESIRTTDITLSLVSEGSLLSGWVAIESLLSFALEELRDQRRFISCHLDAHFFDNSYRLHLTDSIDQKLAELDRLMGEYRDRHLDTNDLNQDKSRLFDLRNNLGKILERLRQSLSVDLSPANFDQGIKLLARTIKSNNPGMAGR